jgi:hypothetical protein
MLVSWKRERITGNSGKQGRMKKPEFRSYREK